MIGLPRSGKTTFLAAFWHVLTQRTGNTLLQLTRLSGEREYLNHICATWCSCSKINRTPVETEKHLMLHLKHQTQGVVDLAIPDLSGEAFDSQISQRRWLRSYDALVGNASGVVLMIHPDVSRGPRIDAAAALEGIIAKPSGPTVEPPDQGAVEPQPWSCDHLPTQVKLVELLQFVLARTEKRLRVGVIVSAWDLVQASWKPRDLLARELPLLSQFLGSNRSSMDAEAFGVSAQGGDLTKDRELLLQKDSPSDRIQVVGPGGRSHDITAPIEWIIR